MQTQRSPPESAASHPHASRGVMAPRFSTGMSFSLAMRNLTQVSPTAVPPGVQHTTAKPRWGAPRAMSRGGCWPDPG